MAAERVFGLRRALTLERGPVRYNLVGVDAEANVEGNLPLLLAEELHS